MLFCVCFAQRPLRCEQLHFKNHSTISRFVVFIARVIGQCPILRDFALSGRVDCGVWLRPERTFLTFRTTAIVLLFMVLLTILGTV